MTDRACKHGYTSECAKCDEDDTGSFTIPPGMGGSIVEIPMPGTPSYHIVPGPNGFGRGWTAHSETASFTSLDGHVFTIGRNAQVVYRDGRTRTLHIWTNGRYMTTARLAEGKKS